MAGVEVAVTPGASRDRVGPLRDGVLAVRTTRPAADGEANGAVVRLVARAVGVAPSQVEIVAGRRGRRKRIEIHGVDEAELGRRLRSIGAD